jgi:hypothetical protein
MMRALLAMAVVALAGCSSAPPTSDDDLARETCSVPCLTNALHVLLEDCDFVGLTVSLPEDTYDLPEGYEPSRPSTLTTHPEAQQLAYLMLLTCQASSINEAAMGPVSFAEIGLIIEPPAGGPGTDFHQFVLQHAATGPLLDALLLRGFPALPGEVSIAPTPTGRIALLEGEASLRADVTHAPFVDGTNPGFSMAHYTADTWFTGYPECTQGAPGTSSALVDPGTSVLTEAAGETGLLRGGDTQDEDCHLDLRFSPVPAA